MSTLHIVFTVLQVIVAIALTVIVLLQTGKSEGLGALSGNSDSFISKNKAKSLDAKLAAMTKWIALVFIVFSLALRFF